MSFAPAHVQQRPEVPVKGVDLRIHLEELAFLLRAACGD